MDSSAAAESMLQSAASVRRQTIFVRSVVPILYVTIRCLRAEADLAGPVDGMTTQVTIRCLRAEADGERLHTLLHRQCYNPLPPCGGRLSWLGLSG